MTGKTEGQVAFSEQKKPAVHFLWFIGILINFKYKEIKKSGIFGTGAFGVFL